MKTGVVLILGLIALSGCSTIGASLGVHGSGTMPKAGKGAMIGGLVAGSLGSNLADADRQKGLTAEYRALEYAQSGQTVSWKDDKEGVSGDVVPAQPYRVGSQDCRQFTHTLYTNGSPRTARGTACRNDDGSWATLS